MQTPKMHWTAYLWPGLSRLWVRGSWAGLAVAVGFTVLANTLLMATLVYSDWMAVNVQLGGYAMLALIWMLAWWESRADRRRDGADSSEDGQSEISPVDQREEERDQKFREMQQCYLRGDWVATEQRLLLLLKQDARDVESRLMLATLWRHQGRDEEAIRQLDRLERLEAASPWQYEIEAERKAIKKNHDAPPEQDQVHNEDISTDETDRRMAA